MNRDIKNFIFKIQGILFKAKEVKLEKEDVVYVDAPLKVWEYIIEKLKNEKK